MFFVGKRWIVFLPQYVIMPTCSFTLIFAEKVSFEHFSHSFNCYILTYFHYFFLPFIRSFFLSFFVLPSFFPFFLLFLFVFSTLKRVQFFLSFYLFLSPLLLFIFISNTKGLNLIKFDIKNPMGNFSFISSLSKQRWYLLKVHVLQCACQKLL